MPLTQQQINEFNPLYSNYLNWRGCENEFNRNPDSIDVRRTIGDLVYYNVDALITHPVPNNIVSGFIRDFRPRTQNNVRDFVGNHLEDIVEDAVSGLNLQNLGQYLIDLRPFEAPRNNEHNRIVTLHNLTNTSIRNYNNRDINAIIRDMKELHNAIGFTCFIEHSTANPEGFVNAYSGVVHRRQGELVREFTQAQNGQVGINTNRLQQYTLTNLRNTPNNDRAEIYTNFAGYAYSVYREREQQAQQQVRQAA